MGAIATWSYGAWIARFPQFEASVPPDLGAQFWTEATLLVGNDGSGPVADVARQTVLLNLATAHIAALNAGENGAPPSPLVGRIASASEGAVSVSVENGFPPGSAQWWQQTRYGAQFWASTSVYRTATYVPAPRRSFDPWRRFF